MLRKYFVLCYFAGVFCCLFWAAIFGYTLAVKHEFSWRSLGAVAVLSLITRIMHKSYYEEKREQLAQEQNNSDQASH